MVQIKHIKDGTKKILLPHLCKIEWFKCNLCSLIPSQAHTKKLHNIVLERIVFNILDNEGRKATDLQKQKQNVLPNVLPKKIVKNELKAMCYETIKIIQCIYCCKIDFNYLFYLECMFIK